MIRLNSLTTLAMIIALAGLTACASGPKRGGPQSGGTQFSGVTAHPVGLYFVGHDTDGDGVTSRAELGIGVKKDWAQFGRNPSATQFQSWSIKALGSSSATPTFLSFDTNLNGSVTQSEFETRLVSEFNRLDRNDDGRLARSELIFNIEARRGNGNGPRGQGGRGSEGRPSGGGRPPR
jgi:hypothetical protein